MEFKSHRQAKGVTLDWMLWYNGTRMNCDGDEGLLGVYGSLTESRFPAGMTERKAKIKAMNAECAKVSAEVGEESRCGFLRNDKKGLTRSPEPLAAARFPAPLGDGGCFGLVDLRVVAPGDAALAGDGGVRVRRLGDKLRRCQQDLR